LKQTDLDWTIYRVGALKNSDAGLFLYRKDIAKFCIDEISENKWIHRSPML
jgi:hypothetical protein